MTVQKSTLASGKVRYRARVAANGRYVASKVFERKSDAVAWEQDQLRRLRRGEWVDPQRGKVTLAFVADSWLQTRMSVKRRTRETDELNWRAYIAPKLGQRAISSLTTAEVSEWAASLVADGKAASTAKRALATLRSVLAHAVADDRLIRNVASTATAPRGRDRREGQALTLAEVENLARAARGPYADMIVILAHTGIRWGELAGLQVGDRVSVPAAGLRLQRAVLASSGSGELFVDALKNYRSRTIPLTPRAAHIVATWAGDRAPAEWLFASPLGTALAERNWKRMVGWTQAKQAIGRPTIRVHDLRHTAASVWLAQGADPKVVQRILGHASATMTMDLYGHLMDANLWDAARGFVDISWTPDQKGQEALDA